MGVGGIKPTICAIAIATALAVVAGCGSASSSGEASESRPESAAAAANKMAGAVEPEAATKPAEASQKKPRDKGGDGKTEDQVPLGVPLDARSAGVRKAIADLLHPDKQSRGEGRSAGAEARTGEREHRGGGLGLLDQIRRATRERLHQIQGRDRDGSQQGGGLHILEMLK